jgi:hypothetical protein
MNISTYEKNHGQIKAYSVNYGNHNFCICQQAVLKLI